MESSLSALLSASLASEAAGLERLAVLEGGLSGVAQAAAAAQAALADAASQGAAASCMLCWRGSLDCGWCAEWPLNHCAEGQQASKHMYAVHMRVLLTG